MDLDKESIEVLNGVLRNVPPLSDEDLAGAVQTKKHSKQKKKDSSFLYGNEMAEILKSNETPEQKLKAVCEKYSETLHANRKLMMANKMAEGRIVKLQQENEQCQQQRSKAVLTRSRLENLCRELQKLNKAQKEEIDLKLRLEEEKRKEISATFQSAFAEMNTLTNQNTEKNTKMREENLEMREKIKSVRERVELSEQQLEKVRQQAQLELQLAEAKMATIKMEMTAEKECLLKEKQQLLLKLTEYQVRISELQATEVGLRSQISMYTEKYDDFQNALTKSNELFSGFNEEMEKMSKKILKLEKETSLWKQRWEKSHAALLEMAADKQARDTEMGKLTHKLSLLQELCKAFQRERAELLAQLRAVNGTTSTTNTSSVDSSKIDNVDIKQVEELSADCQQLKDDLAHLQDAIPAPIKEDKTEESATTCETEPEKKESEVKTNESESSVIKAESETKTKESTTDRSGSPVISDEPKADGNESTIIENKSDTIENQSDTSINIESNIQSCEANKTAKDQVILKLTEQKENIDEPKVGKPNDEDICELTDEMKHIVLISETIAEENKSSDTSTIPSSESPESLEEIKIEPFVEITQCKEHDESCPNESVNDESENLVATLDLVEVKAEECSPDVRVEEDNTMNKINPPIVVSVDEPAVNKNSSDTCAVSEVKKEGINKQNNSNPTKKGSGKRKKK